jgi:hypothetical protein
VRSRRVALCAAVALGAMGRVAAGDPTPPINLHLLTPSTVHTDGGSDLHLPPGYFLDEATRGALDIEMKRLQDAETRLTAENTSLTASVGWAPGWYTLAVTLAAGIALGWYAHDKL